MTDTAEPVAAASAASDAAPNEGVVQFAYALNPATDAVDVPELIAWRDVLMRLGLIGRAPDRYDGYAFGNLSARLAPTAPGTLAVQTPGEQDEQNEDSSAFRGLFVISASQSMQRAHDDPSIWTTIDHLNLERFWCEARGSLPPSSETMTHAMVYAAEPHAAYVFHAHCPQIWRNHEALQLPATPPDVPYGSPQMSRAVIDLLAANMSRPLVFVTLGHEDGVFALGPTARDTGGLLVSYLARALQLEAA